MPTTYDYLNGVPPEPVYEDSKPKIEFLATFPDIQSSFKAGRDSIRIQLDIPASHRDKAVTLLALMGEVLKVTVEVEDDG